MLPPIATDIDLADRISSNIGGAYRQAVEFSKVLPSFALVRFRDVLDGVCEQLAKSANLHWERVLLVDKIAALTDAGAVTFRLRDCLHLARTLCNAGAHQTLPDKPESAKDKQDRHEVLVQHTGKVRDLLLESFEYLYCSSNALAIKPEYIKAAIDNQLFKDVLFDATVLSDADAKYNAGLWCEAEADRRSREFKGIITSEAYKHEQTFLKRLAATFYQSSWILKQNVDAQFRYARFVEQGTIDGEKKHEAVGMIARAAELGHPEACDYFGSILYEDKQDYKNAERFWMQAVQANVTRAYFCLYLLYSKGEAFEADLVKAIAYLKTGAEQGDRDCLDQLGRCYFEGDGVERDEETARVLLQRAVDQGSGLARAYLALKVNRGADVIAGQLQIFGAALLAQTRNQQRTGSGTVEPYALCSCGSGKKYKFCCREKDTAEKRQQNTSKRGIPFVWR